MFKAKYLTSQAKTVFSCNRLLRLKHSSEDYSQPFGKTSKGGQSQTQEYPATKQLSLPLNFEDLNSSERLKFSPQRSRDINGSFISSCTKSSSSFLDLQSHSALAADDRIECYDSSGTINLNSAMQTNVPFPFVSRVKPIHLNMPGGQWRQTDKYVSEDLNNVHHTNTRNLNSRTGTAVSLGSQTGNKNLYIFFPSRNLNFSSSLPFSSLNSNLFRTLCTEPKKIETDKGNSENVNTEKKASRLSMTQKFKNLVKEYGPIVFVLHITISATSLLIIYCAVASGIDTSSITKIFGASEGALTAETATNFIVAFAVHKMLAPVRIAITLTATPFVARKLRKLGILKPKQQ